MAISIPPFGVSYNVVWQSQICYCCVVLIGRRRREKRLSPDAEPEMGVSELPVLLEEAAIRIKLLPKVHAPNLTQITEVLVSDIGELIQLLADSQI